MRLQTSVALSVVAPILALAQSESGDRNLTIALYPSDAEDSCKEGGSGGIALTTETIPRHHTCINVEEIFGGDSRVGFLNDTISEGKYGPDDDTSDLDPPGIHWYISSNDGPSTYDSSKNWTNIWIKQMNGTDNGQEEGKVGSWVITTYGNSDCERVNSDEFPWFTASCQTSEDGTCESSPYSIKSIKLNRLEKYDYDSCQTWAELGDATGLVPRASAALFAAFVAAMLM